MTNNFLCVDCGIDTSSKLGVSEYYMVHDSVWALAKLPEPDAMLCIGCLENRIGRKLTRADFNMDASINNGIFGEQSRRLKNRLRS